VAVELPKVEPPALPAVVPLAPIAVDPLDGAPIAVLPGVVGPDMLPPAVLFAEGPVLEPGLELLPNVFGPVLPMLPLLPGVVVLLATVGSHGTAPGAGPVVVLEVCAKAKPPATSAAATMLDLNALIGSLSS
jgi:hypothetical protein